ncbi:dihydrofolate reductase family protein [Actinacidiphila paucisporea]|uniref:Dihydrofolate reductase n=1 Tax=Actinacidiphila paucisporea TaxID=310782 RepID=A0A1M7P1A0_9ACTN|nr:dihydrofolate reductase family protein [Actinacidiphila paucisporea]SHN10166.1 Dihydrofolate reductase [Actinacidiphila paucisporea]
MRKIIESTLVSLDGVAGDPHLWANDYFDEEAQARARDHLLASDAMLMGRRTYERFAAAWPSLTGEYAKTINAVRKYVFSSTLASADWENTTVIRGDVVAEAAGLRQQDGPDLIMYGHGPLGRTLLEHRLLDEVHLAVHPLVLGGGSRLFHDGEQAALELTAVRTLRTGVVVLSYRPTAD